MRTRRLGYVGRRPVVPRVDLFLVAVGPGVVERPHLDRVGRRDEEPAVCDRRFAVPFTASVSHGDLLPRGGRHPNDPYLIGGRSSGMPAILPSFPIDGPRRVQEPVRRPRTRSGGQIQGTCRATNERSAPSSLRRACWSARRTACSASAAATVGCPDRLVTRLSRPHVVVACVSCAADAGRVSRRCDIPLGCRSHS